MKESETDGPVRTCARFAPSPKVTLTLNDARFARYPVIIMQIASVRAAQTGSSPLVIKTTVHARLVSHLLQRASHDSTVIQSK